MLKILDSNLIIRFLLDDDPVKAKDVETLLLNSSDRLILTDVNLAEIVWVLTSFYKIPKSSVVEKLQNFLAIPTIDADKKLLSEALTIYKKYNIDYIDAYHIAFAQKESIEVIYSYDKDFDKVEGIKRQEP